MLRIRFMLIAFFGLALLATVFLWVYTFHTPAYIGLSMDCRGADGTHTSFAGGQSYGLYAARGRMGWLYHSETVRGLEADELTLFPPHPTRLVWEHGDAPDEGYMGGLAPEQLGYYVRFARWGLTLYDGKDAGMRHLMVLRGGLADTWLFTIVLAAILGVATWGVGGRRRRWRAARGLCVGCGYDLRAHKAGERCPECGTVIGALQWRGEVSPGPGGPMGPSREG